MKIQIVTSIISAISIIFGSLVGAFCSYKIQLNIYNKQSENNYKTLNDNREYEKFHKSLEMSQNANKIRLDIANTLFQGIRCIQNTCEIQKTLYMLPINKDYQNIIASLSHLFDLKELSYIYQLYAIIDKVNKDFYEIDLEDKSSYKKIKLSLINILYKIYGDNYEKVLLLDPDKLTYKELYNNNYILEPYFNTLQKLDFFCEVKNISKENYITF